jgi:type VII secretion integral membrane protein EccD
LSAPTATATAAAAAAAPTTAAATPAQPATTRVTILTGKRMTDVVLPSSAAIETYIDDTLAVLAEILEDTPADVLAGFDFSAQGAWTFARPGAAPLKPDQSLDDAAVVDGSLLTLVPVSRTERYRQLVEDVIDAIAVLDESPEFDRTALNRFIGVAIPVVTVAITVIAALAWWHTGRQHLWWPLALGIGGITALIGSWAVKRFYRNLNLSESLVATAYPLVTVAVALATPRPSALSPLGAPQLAGAAATVLFLTLLVRGGPHQRYEVASFTAVAATAVTVAAIAFGYGWQHWVPAGAIVFGLFTVTNAAKLTVAVARISLPPIPAPGETVEHEELLDPVTGREANDEKETTTWQAIIASVPDSAVRLNERSKLAQQLLIGFVLSGTLVLATGVIAVVVRGHFFIHSLVVAGLVTVACAFRSRLYAERWCAWALLTAVVAIPMGVAAKLSIWYPQSTWLFLTIYLAASLIAVAVVAATIGVRRVSPVMKRTLELFDGALVAAILPMLLWITSVYDIVRNIRF